ncbi:ABC transporter substrate-binding protein [Halomonas sp. KM-1]|uniref:ABC transporter substrate-binding protein n=1 Tax=Halomonas sp. KM-1 TaxID=590061 RepID=UPI000289592B|nr:ABC transporter substrate-binding protein [Halomonas sp. KM-1]
MFHGLVLALRKKSELLALAAAISFASSSALGQQASDEGYILALDFAIAETLFDIADLPIAMGSVDNYKSWTGKNSTPSNLVDIGANPNPNKELISSLNLFSILAPLQYSHLANDLSILAPVAQLSPYNPSSMNNWEGMTTFTKEIGSHINREQEADRFISEAENLMDGLQVSTSLFPETLLVMQLLDEKHVRVYGDNSLPGAVLDRLGLYNAWSGPSNRWGFATISISELFNHDVHFVIIDTSHLQSKRIIQENVMSSELWNLLPSVQKNNITMLNAEFWVFGAIPSATFFAESLVNAFIEN